MQSVAGHMSPCHYNTPPPVTMMAVDEVVEIAVVWFV